jgi:glutamate-1-semialdehyde 2,1-aminomutase
MALANQRKEREGGKIMADADSNGEIEKKLASRMKKSYTAYELAKTVIPAGVMSRARLLSPYPFYVREGKGSKIIDLDGNEIIDCAMGYGPLLLGHAHPVVTEAIREAVGRGSQFGIPHEEEYRLARLMADTVPTIEKVSFCNSGTEAIYQAVRIIRVFTGKKKIAKFEGGYHGGTNEVLANFKYNKEKGGPPENPVRLPGSIGIPEEAQANLIILPFNHEAAFDIIKKSKDDLAAVLVEVIQGMAGNIVGRRNFIQGLRKVTKDLGIPLLLDEIITGYRLGLGGGQEFYGIEADIATYGKIMGGGLPMGAVAGKNSIMEIIAYTGDPEIDTKKKPFYGGTFNGNLLSTIAGAATLEYLIAHPEIYPEMERLGNKLRDKVNRFCKEHNLPAQMIGLGSMFCTHFTDKEIDSVRVLADENMKAARAFYPHLLYEGVFIPNVHMGFISAAHTEEDVDRIIVAHCKALKAVRDLGLL